MCLEVPSRITSKRLRVRMSLSSSHHFFERGPRTRKEKHPFPFIFIDSDVIVQMEVSKDGPNTSGSPGVGERWWSNEQTQRALLPTSTWEQRTLLLNTEPSRRRPRSDGCFYDLNRKPGRAIACRGRRPGACDVTSADLSIYPTNLSVIAVSLLLHWFTARCSLATTVYEFCNRTAASSCLPLEMRSTISSASVCM